MKQCSIEDCERRHYGKGLCSLHYQRQYHGRPLDGPNRDIIGYRAAHVRVEKKRGKASSHHCVDCHRPAQEWSLNHNAVDVLYSNTSNSAGKPYSLAVMDYQPRCIHCHHLYDGIDFAPENRRNNGRTA